MPGHPAALNAHNMRRPGYLDSPSFLGLRWWATRRPPTGRCSGPGVHVGAARQAPPPVGILAGAAHWVVALWTFPEGPDLPGPPTAVAPQPIGFLLPPGVNQVCRPSKLVQ